MADITIQIDKQEVYEEVYKVTAYIGGKNVDTNGKTLYDQVFVTDADKEMIDSFSLIQTSHIHRQFLFVRNKQCCNSSGAYSERYGNE